MSGTAKAKQLARDSMKNLRDYPHPWHGHWLYVLCLSQPTRNLLRRHALNSASP